MLIFVMALCIVAFLARRFGYDSRASAWSKEAEIGAHGVTWEPHAGCHSSWTAEQPLTYEALTFPSHHGGVRRARKGTGGERRKVTESGAMVSRSGGRR